eukprot:12975347-Ditylum_brightwellii.AAC.1
MGEFMQLRSLLVPPKLLALDNACATCDGATNASAALTAFSLGIRDAKLVASHDKSVACPVMKYLIQFTT